MTIGSESPNPEINSSMANPVAREAQIKNMERAEEDEDNVDTESFGIAEDSQRKAADKEGLQLNKKKEEWDTRPSEDVEGQAVPKLNTQGWMTNDPERSFNQSERKSLP